MASILNKHNVDTTGNKKWFTLCKTVGLFNKYYAVFTVIASEQFFDLKDMLEGTNYYNGKIQSLVMKCENEWKRYWKCAKRMGQERYPIWIDYGTEMATNLEHDIKMLYYSIKSCLDKTKIIDSDIKAQAILVSELHHQPALFYDEFWVRAKESTGYDFKKHFGYANINRQYDYANEIVRIMCEKDMESDGFVDPSEDKNCLLGINALVQNIGNNDKLDKAAEKALYLNQNTLKV